MLDLENVEIEIRSSYLGDIPIRLKGFDRIREFLDNEWSFWSKFNGNDIREKEVFREINNYKADIEKNNHIAENSYKKLQNKFDREPNLILTKTSYGQFLQKISEENFKESKCRWL